MINNSGLGRLVSKDDRDKAFPMKAALPPTGEQIMTRYWNQSAYWGDQGKTSMCVAYAWTHWLTDGPITHKNFTPKQAEIYNAAQLVDEWEGTGYDGTSVRAGAKVLQSMGMVGAYTWSWSVEEIAAAIIHKGPVVAGTNWYNDMFKPSHEGIIKPVGKLAGGHAYLLNGVNINKGLFRIKNSWGRDWAKQGNAYISFKHMQTLLNESGECCLAIENKL